MSLHGACVLALAGMLCVPQHLAAAEQRPEDQYILFAELHPPYEKNRAALQKLLKAEGHDSYAEGDQELALALTAGQINKLFQAKVRLRKVEASATTGSISQPYLEGARIPARFGKLIRRVYFDPQRG